MIGRHNLTSWLWLVGGQARIYLTRGVLTAREVYSVWCRVEKMLLRPIRKKQNFLSFNNKYNCQHLPTSIIFILMTTFRILIVNSWALPKGRKKTRRDKRTYGNYKLPVYRKWNRQLWTLCTCSSKWHKRENVKLIESIKHFLVIATISTSILKLYYLGTMIIVMTSTSKYLEKFDWFDLIFGV